MDDKALENKFNRDLDKVKQDLAALGDDGATGLGRKFEHLTADAKQKVAEGVNTINQEVGQGLSQYNAKIQEVADRVPGDFSKKVASYPWVTITMSLFFGFLLGVLIKPSRQPVG